MAIRPRPPHWPDKDTPKAERKKRDGSPAPKLRQKGRQRKNRARKANG